MLDAGPLSLLPVVVAIGLALWSRHVILSLFVGSLVAGLIVAGGNPWTGLLHVVDPLIIGTIADRDHVKITVFGLLIAGAVEVMSQSGGTLALVDRVTRRATTRRSGMIATWVAGLIVFFDDYANCLVVGNAMRPVSDRLRISREKLAYLVDSTAAPMATVALLSTWVGYEIGLIADALKAAGQDTSPYAFFVQGLPYRFYPILALVFAGLIAFSGRDFGPMYKAESRHLARPFDEAEPTRQPGWKLWLAVVPILALVGVTAASLWVQGSAEAPQGATIIEIIGGADGYDAMVQGSSACLSLAVLLAAVTRAMGIAPAFQATITGMQSLFEPLVILFLAWSLSAGIGELHASDYLVGLVGDSITPVMLPSVVFLVGAGISFATGTSFGTMGVLMPLVIPLALSMPGGNMQVTLAASAAVLSGATWGDHCSPISDTTVLSSTGSGCEHTAHVTTQLPYALAAGAVSLVACSIPAGFGLNPWVCLALGAVGCWAVVRFAGRVPV